MCGRYATTRARQELLDEFQVQVDAVDGDIQPDYNVAPTKQVPAVLNRRPKDAPEGEAAVRQLRTVRWGLVPSWAKDLSIGSRMINARFETVHEKPSYRRAFARRRCLLPADGYFEWYTIQDQGGSPDPAEGEKRAKKKKPQKQPYFIRPNDGEVMAMAGLYELWKAPKDAAAEAGLEEGEWVWTCTVITTDAPDDLGRIHDRMPMIVERDRWDAWLDPELTDTEQVRGLLVPAMAGTMDAYPVSKAVNSVRNNGPELIEPVISGDSPDDQAGSLF
ncbi:Putative SOS response-associated peptidase YedK [Actinomadura meyerae]|jgi:putative SOS response-associated peptidase YedK|uniref:Abasic site processing protein n=1 Tax=Actinomadura meyerae TaxID=240840 RepID=A0A239HPY3_9ACTN|nr:SOS response-associated peptidase [Actinomadura meyerae]SNS83205.1 Putative SOS response-associated peptidase YedK [Actinomadura meyerae]